MCADCDDIYGVKLRFNCRNLFIMWIRYTASSTCWLS